MRLEPHQRRAVIITSAVRIAKEAGLCKVTHGDVAKRCTVATSVALVRHYFPERAMMWAAVVAECPEMADQGRELGLKC
jgi:DNA-binding transcriptional regulator YbjK